MITRIDDVHPAPYNMVRLKKAGPILEVRYMQNRTEPAIVKISRDEYVEKKTGEVKPFCHTERRVDNRVSLAASMQRLRDLLFTNVTDPRKALWCTLTYRAFPTEKQVYEDFRRFNQRLKNYILKAHGMGYQYIACWEFQSRGSLHCHMVLIFPKRRPFLPSSTLADLWTHGFVSVKALRDTDRVANYLCSYLTDLPLEEAISLGISVNGSTVKEVGTQDETGRKSAKYYAKGARLALYNPGFHLYRTSRGIKRPEITECTAIQAMHEIGGAPCIFERTVAVYPDDSDTPVNIINYRKYDVGQESRGKSTDKNTINYKAQTKGAQDDEQTES